MYVILCWFLFFFCMSLCETNKNCQVAYNSDINIWDFLNRILLPYKNINKRFCQDEGENILASISRNSYEDRQKKLNLFFEEPALSSVLEKESNLDKPSRPKISLASSKPEPSFIPIYRHLEKLMDTSRSENLTDDQLIKALLAEGFRDGKRPTSETPLTLHNSKYRFPMYLRNHNSMIHWHHSLPENTSPLTTVNMKLKSSTIPKFKTTTSHPPFSSTAPFDTVKFVPTYKYILNSTLSESLFEDQDESVFIYVSINPYQKFSDRHTKDKQKGKDTTKKSTFQMFSKKPPGPTTATSTKKIQNQDQKKLKNQKDHSNSKSSSPDTSKITYDDIAAVEYSIFPYNKSLSLRDYVKYISERTAYMHHKNTMAWWNYETNMNHKAQKIAMLSGLELIHYNRKLNSLIDLLGKEAISDPILLREIKLLYCPGKSALPDIKIAEFEEIIFAMDTIYHSASVNKWNAPQEKLKMDGIQKAMAKSQSPEELKYYWIEWRNATGKKLKNLFEQYIELLNLTAASNGYSNPGEMWTRDYETDDLMEPMESHWEQIKPLYMELHAYVRSRLHQHYGDIAIPSDFGPIPAHLTGDLWGQNWKNLYTILQPYKMKQKQISLQEQGYTVNKLTETADKFYHSLGFSGLPDVFWKKSIFLKPGPDFLCEPSAWDMHNGHDFRIKMCYNGTLDDFFNIHHELAHVLYFREYRNLSFPFRKGPNPAFHEAMAGAILLSVRSPVHLHKVGLSNHKNNDETDINYLFNMALEKLAFLPFSYIVDLWRYRVFKGVIRPRDYNSEWWRLRLKYQGISPAVKRDDEDFDPGSKYHIIANKPYAMNFISTLLEFQFHDALCRRSNIIGPTEPLHKCDIYNSFHAGQMLKSVMQMGASQHWKVALKELTENQEINSRPMKEFFNPLYEWLKKENAKKVQKIGWE